MIDSGGDMYERVEYDAQGNARHRYDGDVNGDGVFTTSDLFTANGASGITSTKYHADIDTDFDGMYQTDEITAYSSAPSTALPDGWISDPSSATGPDNSIGYAGYVCNHEREDYTVRFRNYNPELGRWMQRDPVGYIDGSNLFSICLSAPTRFTDPLGLTPGGDHGNYTSFGDGLVRGRRRPVLLSPGGFAIFSSTIDYTEFWIGTFDMSPVYRNKTKFDSSTSLMNEIRAMDRSNYDTLVVSLHGDKQGGYCGKPTDENKERYFDPDCLTNDGLDALGDFDCIIIWACKAGGGDAAQDLEDAINARKEPDAKKTQVVAPVSTVFRYHHMQGTEKDLKAKCEEEADNANK